MNRKPEPRQAPGRLIAARLVAALENRELVPSFVDEYVKEFGRQGLVLEALQRAELLAAVKREALLTMLSRILAELSSRLAASGRSVSKREALRAATAVPKDSVASLAKVSGWDDEEIVDFRKDLNLYMRLVTRRSREALTTAPKISRSGRRVTAKSGGRSSSLARNQAVSVRATRSEPFVDRVGFLLDASLMESSRGASARFLVQLDAIADAALAAAFPLKPRRR